MSEPDPRHDPAGEWPDPPAPPPQPPPPPPGPPFWQPPPAYPGPPGYPGPGGYGHPRSGPNGLAITSLVVSIAGAVALLCAFCLFPLGVISLAAGVAGAVLGHAARRQIRERGTPSDGMALAGIIVGWIATGVAVVVIAASAITFGTSLATFSS